MPAAKDPTARLVMEILDGRHDGRFKEIVEAVAEAIQKRQDDGHTRFVWRITLGDDVWDALSVTVGELRYAERATGIPWKKLNPADSMGEFAALVVGHFKAQGMELDEAVEKAEAITQQEAEAAIDDYELVSPPKAGSSSAASTPT